MKRGSVASPHLNQTRFSPKNEEGKMGCKTTVEEKFGTHCTRLQAYVSSVPTPTFFSNFRWINAPAQLNSSEFGPPPVV